MDSKKIKLTIDSDLTQVSLIGMAIHKFCLATSLSLSESYNIELCVVEAVTNSIKHSYGGERGKEVSVVFTLAKDRLVITVFDCGAAMDPHVLENADLACPKGKTYDIEQTADSGRGLAIMKRIMDRVTYRSEEGANCLTLVKNIPPIA